MLPWAMPAFVAFLTWRVLYQPIGGGINLILDQTGIYTAPSTGWASARPAMPAVIVASVWRGFPFWFVSILAALQAVPKRTLRSGHVDGASAWQRFWTVTVPGIRHVVIVTTLLSSIWTANGFEHVWLLTQGGPSDATMVFPVLAYFGMQTQRIGEAAAVSVYMPARADHPAIFATSLMLRKDERMTAIALTARRARWRHDARPYAPRPDRPRPELRGAGHGGAARALPDLLDGDHVAQAAARDPAHAVALAAGASRSTITDMLLETGTSCSAIRNSLIVARHGDHHLGASSRPSPPTRWCASATASAASSGG